MKGNLKRVVLAVGMLAVASVSQAAVIRYQTALTPEAPGATGSGFVIVDYDSTARTLFIDADWTGLSGTTTVAHIHCCTTLPGEGTVGVAVTPGTLPGFPVGLTAGNYTTSPVLDLSSSGTYTNAFLTGAGGTAAGAEARLIVGIEDGLAYFNVHSTTFPAGEIRGFLAPVPEPGTYALLALGAVGLLWSGRRSSARG